MNRKSPFLLGVCEVFGSTWKTLGVQNAVHWAALCLFCVSLLLPVTAHRYGMIGLYLPQAHWELVEGGRPAWTLFHREKELFFILWVGGCHSAYVEVGCLFAGVGSSLPPHRSLTSNSGLRARWRPPLPSEPSTDPKRRSRMKENSTENNGLPWG